MKKIKLILFSFIYFLFFTINAFSESFDEWKKSFSKYAISEGISDQTLFLIEDFKFLPKVIEYDRYQPEFYEDTFTYIKKRSSNRKIREGLKLYKKDL